MAFYFGAKDGVTMFLSETNVIYRGVRPLQKLSATARDIVLQSPLANLAYRGGAVRHLRTVPPDPWAGDPQKGRDLISGIFCFAGQTISRNDLSWAPEAASLPWMAELHSFEWLRDLRSVGGDRARRMAREMVLSWIENNPQEENTLSFRSDVVGIRLSNWIAFHDFFCSTADESFRRKYFLSLLQQATYLSKSLPGQIFGIPLFKAIKGLVYAGLALEGQSLKLEYGIELVLAALSDQMLGDGGHVSRSPKAAFDMLQCLVDIRMALNAARINVPAFLQDSIDRISTAVRFFRHNDGGLCQFNGAQEGIAHIFDATLMHSGAKNKTVKSLETSRYEKIQMGRSTLIMDTGALPAHRYAGRAHAGMLSFEYVFGKDRVFVNCGTSDVTEKWQKLLRSTAAHTTVCVDHRSFCSFDPSGLTSEHIDVQSECKEDADLVMITAEHNGYVPRYGIRHQRRVSLSHHGEVLQGEDILSGTSGTCYAARFHLHPSIQASLIKDGEEILLRAKSGNGWRFKADGFKPVLEDSVYADTNTAPRRTLQIVLEGSIQDACTRISWELKREKI